MKNMNLPKALLDWGPQIVAAAILAMAMVPKLMGAPEAIDTFTKLGIEPWGRYLLGLLELGTAVLLLMPSKRVLGALAASTLMVGALGSHATVLGFSGDAGAMAAMAVVVLLSSLTVLSLHRDELRKLVPR